MSPEKSIKQPELSIVVPLFNEEAIINELIQRINVASMNASDNYELVIVNDGSKDKTLTSLLDLTTKIPELTIVDLSRNFGHMQAVSAGLKFSSGKAVVIMDGDLQDPPEIIPEMLGKWKNGAEVVLARRTERNEKRFQKAMTAIFYRIIKTIGEIPIPEQVGTFCLIDKRIVNIINQMPERARFFAGLRAWAGFRTEIVEYKRPERKNGKSKIGLLGQLSLAKRGIISFSNWPLVWLSRFSLLASICLFIFGLCIIGIKLYSDLAIPGWASTMVLVGMVSSMNSAGFAIFSEYLAVIFEEIKQRPHFLTSNIYRNGKIIE
jgi:glycosyltransferase involved in cell wall biosynthesis